MIMFIAEEVSFSQQIYIEATNKYLVQSIDIF